MPGQIVLSSRRRPKPSDQNGTEQSRRGKRKAAGMLLIKSSLIGVLCLCEHFQLAGFFFENTIVENTIV
jgi:hypothetical protein